MSPCTHFTSTHSASSRVWWTRVWWTRVCVQPEFTKAWHILPGHLTGKRYVSPEPGEGVGVLAICSTCPTSINGQSKPRYPGCPHLQHSCPNAYAALGELGMVSVTAGTCGENPDEKGLVGGLRGAGTSRSVITSHGCPRGCSHHATRWS